MNSFLAHSGKQQNGSDGQSLIDHLCQVGQYARQFARFTPLGDLAHVAGLLHDLGKYSAEYQLRVRGVFQSVNHATAGAVEASQRYGQLGKLLAFVIAGHHAGLANGIDEGKSRRSLAERLKADIPKLDPAWRQQLQLPTQLFPPKMKGHTELAGFQIAFLTRMLYSCLVDADFIDTDAFYRALEGKSSRSKCKLQEYVDEARSSRSHYA